ncbi:MAG: hypothetical protein JWM16_895 [Verrucomicrobiales bacterium]|nr:hypothetical protein [Verrucomicrobiales bacterium]
MGLLFRLAGFTATLLAGSGGHNRARQHSNGKEGEIHDCSGLLEMIFQERRQRKIHGTAVVHAHQNQEQQDHDKKQCFQEQFRIHNTIRAAH